MWERIVQAIVQTSKGQKKWLINHKPRVFGNSFMIKIINVAVPIVDPILRRPLRIVFVELLSNLDHVLGSRPGLGISRLLQIEFAYIAQRDILVPVQNNLEVPALAPDVDIGDRYLEFVQPAEHYDSHKVRYSAKME